MEKLVKEYQMSKSPKNLIISVQIRLMTSLTYYQKLKFSKISKIFVRGIWGQIRKLLLSCCCSEAFWRILASEKYSLPSSNFVHTLNKI